MTLGEAIDRVRWVLGGNVDGECYAASEAVYHLAGGKGAGLTPMVMRVDIVDPVYDQMTHWFLRGPYGEVIDLTAGQFDRIPDYSRARGCGFQTREPSRHARRILEVARG